MTRWVIVLALSGCGLTMTRGPGPTPPGQRPACTESMSAPYSDAGVAGAGLFAMLIGALFLEADDNRDTGVPLLVGGGALVVGAYVSGGVGYYRVKRCRRAIADWERTRLE